MGMPARRRRATIRLFIRSILRKDWFCVLGQYKALCWSQLVSSRSSRIARRVEAIGSAVPSPSARCRRERLSFRPASSAGLPSREFARRLGVARNTVISALEQLTAEGYLEARVGAGTFVTDALSYHGARHARSQRRARCRRARVNSRQSRIVSTLLVPRSARCASARPICRHFRYACGSASSVRTSSMRPPFSITDLRPDTHDYKRRSRATSRSFAASSPTPAKSSSPRGRKAVCILRHSF